MIHLDHVDTCGGAARLASSANPLLSVKAIGLFDAVPPSKYLLGPWLAAPAHE